jgi:pSer/pThr/pTyr-binding forkhead associated (FHA) protein
LSFINEKKDEDDGESSTLISEGEPARLILETEGGAGKEFLINKRLTTIGRHVDNDICLPEEITVSRFHGKILFDRNRGTYFFEDLNSTNGTTIGGDWFKNEKREIKHGDRIILGRTPQGRPCLRFYTRKLGLKDWILG